MSIESTIRSASIGVIGKPAQRGQLVPPQGGSRRSAADAVCAGRDAP